MCTPCSCTCTRHAHALPSPPTAQAERAEVLSAEVIWPLFHYIPLSMLESDTDMIHQRWEDYTHLNQAFAAEISKMWQKVSIASRGQ